MTWAMQPYQKQSESNAGFSVLQPTAPLSTS